MPHRFLLTISLALLALLAPACLNRPVADRVERSMCPTPFTAEQIQAANPPGTRLVYLFEALEEGKVRRTMHFLADDGERATIESSQVDAESGEALGKASTEVQSWAELRDHASFPAMTTDRRETTVSIVAGDFDCWLYTVFGENQKTRAKQVNRFYFAHELPGPPVLFESEEDRGLVRRMELIERQGP